MGKNKCRIDVTNALCSNCRVRKVTADASFSSTSTHHHGKIKSEIDNNINTYWSCDGCGAVVAIMDGKYYDKPTDLFDKVRLDHGKK